MRFAASAKFFNMAVMVELNEFNGSRHSLICVRTEMSFRRSSTTNFDSKGCKPAGTCASVRRSKPAPYAHAIRASDSFGDSAPDSAVRADVF
jgi:hypothetical protein